MTDPYPNIDEFGPGSCTCLGTMTGCAVCSTANILVRYGRPIPRLSDGTPDMRTLGRRMGARHRAADATVRHGLSLNGICTGGTNWCAYCAYLELRAAGLPALYTYLNINQIESMLGARKPIILPGRYSRVPLVSEGSYSRTTPARGRSDSGFGGAHMVTAWQVGSRYSSGEIRDFIVSDSDFGSPSRPVVPPHSIWTRATLRNYWSYYGWAVTYINRAPPTIVVDPTRYRTVVNKKTPVFDRPEPEGGRQIGSVSSATYITSRQKSGGKWWYRIINAANGTTGLAGRWMPAEPWFTNTAL